MNKFIKILKIGLIAILINILGFGQSLYAFERDGIREERKQREGTIDNKIINPEFREFRRNTLLKVENGKLTQDEARIILRKERLKLEDKISEVENQASNIIQTNNEVHIENKTQEINDIKPLKRNLYLRDNPDFQKRKNNAVGKLKMNNQEKRKLKEDTRRLEMKRLKDDFENYRTDIFSEVKNGELTIDEAKIKLDTYRKDTIVKQRGKYKQERELERQEHKQRVDGLIQSKIEEKFSKYDGLTKSEQIEKYNKILIIITKLNKSSNLSNKQKTLLKIIEEVILVKKKD